MATCCQQTALSKVEQGLRQAMSRVSFRQNGRSIRNRLVAYIGTTNASTRNRVIVRLIGPCPTYDDQHRRPTAWMERLSWDLVRSGYVWACLQAGPTWCECAVKRESGIAGLVSSWGARAWRESSVEVESWCSLAAKAEVVLPWCLLLGLPVKTFAMKMLLMLLSMRIVGQVQCCSKCLMSHHWS